MMHCLKNPSGCTKGQVIAVTAILITIMAIVYVISIKYGPQQKVRGGIYEAPYRAVGKGFGAAYGAGVAGAAYGRERLGAAGTYIGETRAGKKAKELGEAVRTGYRKRFPAKAAEVQQPEVIIPPVVQQ